MEFNVQAIEIISVGSHKMASYAIGQPVDHIQDCMGLNLRYKKISPNFSDLIECEEWTKENFHKSRDFRFKKRHWECSRTGGHYESKITCQSRSGRPTGKRVVLKDLVFYGFKESPFG